MWSGPGNRTERRTPRRALQSPLKACAPVPTSSSGHAGSSTRSVLDATPRGRQRIRIRSTGFIGPCLAAAAPYGGAVVSGIYFHRRFPHTAPRTDTAACKCPSRPDPSPAGANDPRYQYLALSSADAIEGYAEMPPLRQRDGISGIEGPLSVTFPRRDVTTVFRASFLSYPRRVDPAASVRHRDIGIHPRARLSRWIYLPPYPRCITTHLTKTRDGPGHHQRLSR